MGMLIIPTSSFPFVFNCWLHSYVMWCSLGLQLENIRLQPRPRPRPDLQSQIRPRSDLKKIKSGATLIMIHRRFLPPFSVLYILLRLVSAFLCLYSQLSWLSQLTAFLNMHVPAGCAKVHITQAVADEAAICQND